MVWIISILICATVGAMFGSLVNTRALWGANYIPTYIVLGCLWGVSLAYEYTRDKKKYKGKGTLMTETKEYKKKLEKKDKTKQ